MLVNTWQICSFLWSRTCSTCFGYFYMISWYIAFCDLTTFFRDLTTFFRDLTTFFLSTRFWVDIFDYISRYKLFVSDLQLMSCLTLSPILIRYFLLSTLIMNVTMFLVFWTFVFVVRAILTDWNDVWKT